MSVPLKSSQFARPATTRKRGFTLLESLLAASILLIIVLSVTMAVTAGQQHGLEAQQRISATLAAEELLGRISIVDFKELRKTWHNHREEVGEMVDMNGNPMPNSFAMIGRSVVVTNTVKYSPKAGVNVLGRSVIVRAFDDKDDTLAEVRRFIAYPTPGLTNDEMNDLLIEMNAQ